MKQPLADTNNLSEESLLIHRRDALITRKTLAQSWFKSAIASLVFVNVVPALIYVFWGSSISSNSISLLVIGIICIDISMILGLASLLSSLKQYDEAIQDIDFEIDLLKYFVAPQERRAEKLLRISDIQLRRYYNLNLNQNIWVFCLGVFCILIGIGVICITLFFLLQIADDTETKIIAGAVGAIGSILVNYVAAIYLKIHAETASNLSSFHSRLVETHQMLLANLLAARIEDADKRWDTISQLSVNVGRKITDDQ